MMAATAIPPAESSRALTGAPFFFNLPKLLGACPPRDRENIIRVEMYSCEFMAESAAMMTTKLRMESANGMPITCITVTNGLSPSRISLTGAMARISDRVRMQKRKSLNQVTLKAFFAATSGSFASPAATAIISMLR
ncbi:hypothetical protein D3C74_350850 [compost metagenome]